MRNISSILMLLFLASCATRGIMPDAIAKGETINITVKQLGGAFAPVYFVVIKKTGEEYELIHTEDTIRTIYKFPSNKLELLSAMELSFKDLRNLNAKYFSVSIVIGNKQRSYKINTDIVHDLITGLKKK